jgi:hypothetical protein
LTKEAQVRRGTLGAGSRAEWTHRVLEPATMKYCIRKPQMTAGAYRKANRVAGSRHAIDKQAEELVFEAACALDSAIGSPRQRRCTCLQTGGLPLLFPRLVDASG